MNILKIAVIGPESTGKSTLAEALAKHFRTEWVPEYAREYLEKLDRPYEEADLLKIAQGQKVLEEKLLANAKGFLFCDTTLVVVKVWSEHKYGRCHPWIAEQVARMRYDYFLLTDIDLPWEPDPLREHPQMRDYFFSIYREYLIDNGLPYSLISGEHEQRMEKALGAVKGISV